MSTTYEQLAEWRDVDAATFRDRIAPLGQPAVLRGLVRQWPVVQQGGSSPRAMCAYLLGLRQGAPVPLLTAEPAVK